MDTAGATHGVYYRDRQRRPWRLVALAESDEAARAKMYELMGRRGSGDWRSGPVGPGEAAGHKRASR